MYNPYNLEARTNSSLSSLFNVLIKTFKTFLYSEKISKGSIRSYVSDVRHFLNWFVSFLEQNHICHSRPDRESIKINYYVDSGSEAGMTIDFLKYVNQKVLESYKDYQLSNNIPLKTINRRFSSLRRFGSFCKSQNWMTLSPFESLRNISQKSFLPADKHYLTEFGIELWKKGVSKSTTKNYLNDVKQFVTWVDSRGFLADFRGSDPVSKISVNPPVIRANHK